MMLRVGSYNHVDIWSCVRLTMLWGIVCVVVVDFADNFGVFDVVDVVILFLYC
jgi:hypothetical protein